MGVSKMDFKFDCRHFIHDKPCIFHKQNGYTCAKCDKYKKIRYNILILKLDALGDVLRTTSILGPIHKKYPDAFITWITRKDALPLFKNNQMVDRVLSVEDPETIYVLLNERFNIVFSVDTNYMSMLLASTAKTRERRGFWVNANREVNIYPADNKYASLWLEMGLDDTMKKDNKLTYQEIILNICDLPKEDYEIVLKLSPEEIRAGLDFLKENKIDKNKYIIIGINPSSGVRWQTKRWPVEKYVSLIKRLGEKFSNVKFLLYGGESDRDVVEGIVKASASFSINTGINEMRRFLSLLNLCDLLITGDTLALHAALSLHKKAIALFGPTSSAEVYLYGKGEKLFSKVPCITCYRGTCDSDIECMKGISVESVMASLERLLQDAGLKREAYVK